MAANDMCTWTKWISNIWLIFISLWPVISVDSQPDMVPFSQTDHVLQQSANLDYDDLDFNGLPGVQYEFKIDIAPGSEECFFQLLKKDSHLLVSFEVLRGADRNVDMAVKAPDGRFLATHLWTNEGTTEDVVQQEGTYAFCIDNSASRFSHKLVYFYMASFVKQDWEQYAKEFENFEVSVKNVTGTLDAVHTSVRDMINHVAVSRKHSSADAYIALSNNRSVQNWSILMCAVIMLTSGVQVFFVRRLFSTSNVTPTAKPRA